MPARALSTALLALAGLLGVAAPASAGVSVSHYQMCQMANYVVVGTVTARESARGEAGKIRTTITVEVTFKLGGEPGESLALMVEGGQVDEEVQVVDWQPEAPVGSRYLFLLIQRGDGPPGLVGGKTGARRLADDETRSDAEVVKAWQDGCVQQMLEGGDRELQLPR